MAVTKEIAKKVVVNAVANAAKIPKQPTVESKKREKNSTQGKIELKLFNTLSRSLEVFKPVDPKMVKLYTCGPTVYHYAHIGNLRTYIFEDILKRTLKKFGYPVHHVMNITDVGHLQSDADSGDDKMLIASKREKKDPKSIALFYEAAFFRDFKRLNLQSPDKVCRATDNIPEIISFIKVLESKGYTYTVDNNVYFDIQKFPTYADFGKLKLDTPSVSRVDHDPRKRNQNDFVLWFSQSKFPNQIMKWNSPWGVGFPGWHIECSTMALNHLGDKLDIHCGGIDHIPVHHTNEIAQSEAYLGRKWVNFWLHGEFLTVESPEKSGNKMSKSTGDFLTLDKLCSEGFEPVHYRFFCLNSHYRNNLGFSFDSLESARKDFELLKNYIISWQYANKEQQEVHEKKADAEKQFIFNFKKDFFKALSNDLNTHDAMAVFRKVIKSDKLSIPSKMELLLDLDEILGLGVSNFKRQELNDEQKKILEDRAIAKKDKKYDLSDKLRKEFNEKGFLLNDEPDGSVTWYKKRLPGDDTSLNFSSYYSLVTLLQDLIVSEPSLVKGEVSKDSQNISELIIRYYLNSEDQASLLPPAAQNTQTQAATILNQFNNSKTNGHKGEKGEKNRNKEKNIVFHVDKVKNAT